MITEIHSVLIYSEELQRLVPFYRDVLGLKPEMESEEFVVFQSPGGPRLGLGAHSEVKGRSRDPHRVMVDFAVDDCQSEYERLSGRGVEFVRKPSAEDGFIVATFLDPDGNVLQLFQEAPAG